MQIPEFEKWMAWRGYIFVRRNTSHRVYMHAQTGQKVTIATKHGKVSDVQADYARQYTRKIEKLAS